MTPDETDCAIVSSSAMGAPVTFTSIGYAGSGCSASSAFAVIANDGSQAILSFDEFVASATCQISATFAVQPGAAPFSISITGRGYDNLDPGVIGTLTNTINFAGQPSTTTVTSVTGNGSTYTFGNMGVFFVNQPTASNPVLIIDQGLTLTNPVWGTGFLSLDSLDLTLADAPASVPEPASLAILSVGLAGFAALKRRRTT